MMENSRVLSWQAGAEILNKTLGFQLKELDKVIVNNIPFAHSQEIGDWESLSDEALFEKMVFEGNKYFDMVGDIFAVTDVSYLQAGGIFTLDPKRSSDFFQEYFERFGECFFNGDVFFILPEVSRLVLFQHNGLFLFYETPIECT